MKTRIVCCLLIALTGNAYSLHAQTNLYPDSISGFEINFYVNSNPTPANVFTAGIATDRKYDGLRSVKFDCPDASLPTGGNANAILGGTNPVFPSGNIAVTAGDYTFKAMIFVVDKAPANLTVFLAEKSITITNGITLTIPLSNVTTGSWDTISHPVTFPEDIAEMKTGIRIKGADYAGMTGSSTIYIDQIGLIPADKEVNDTEVIYSPILDPNCTWEINDSYSDEFNSPVLDLGKWDIDVKDWGTWSWEPDNVYLTDTVLTIRMKQQQHTRNGEEYYFTSGIAQIKKEFTYGYFEAKIKASDKGQGTCPAFWVYSVGQPVPTEEGGVQYSEIDAVEIFQVPNQYKQLEMNLHARIIENGVLTWKRPGQGDIELCHNGWDAPWDPRDDYHTYAVWNRLDSIFWYVDEIQRGAKKNFFWHLPMHLTVSMGLRTPYEKYIDGVRTVVPYPESTPEPGFPTEMYCDYVRVWNTPPQLFADPEKYLNAEFMAGSNLEFDCRYFAGNGQTVLADNWNGVSCKLQEIKADGTVVRELELADPTAVGKESGVASFSFSLSGLTPSTSLPNGNQYILKPVFRSSNNGGEDVFLSDGFYPILIAPASTVSSPSSKPSERYFSIFPNPAGEHITIQFNDPGNEPVLIRIYNELGVLVIQQDCQPSQVAEMDISGLRKGLYLVKAGTRVHKLIVQ